MQTKEPTNTCPPYWYEVVLTSLCQVSMFQWGHRWPAQCFRRGGWQGSQRGSKEEGEFPGGITSNCNQSSRRGMCTPFYLVGGQEGSDNDCKVVMWCWTHVSVGAQVQSLRVRVGSTGEEETAAGGWWVDLCVQSVGPSQVAREPETWTWYVEGLEITIVWKTLFFSMSSSKTQGFKTRPKISTCLGSLD